MTMRVKLSSMGSSLSDYVHLTKPRIAALLVFTALSTLIVASGGDLPSFTTIVGVACGGWLAAAGASALNQYLERDLDARMKRTRSRPIPSGRITPIDALIFGLLLVIWSFLGLWLLVNLLAAVLALLGVFYYVGIYTLLLKQNTVFNVVIGGAAGGFPVLVGWAAAVNTLEIGAFLLFAVIFFWTPPHSWALSLLIHDDYERGTIPMMPVVQGAAVTCVHICWYSLHLILLTFLVYLASVAGVIYLISAVILAIGLAWYVIQLLKNPLKEQAKRLYKYSSYYLLILFLALMIDAMI